MPTTHRYRLAGVLASLTCTLLSQPALAGGIPTLQTVEVTGTPAADLIGQASTASEGTVTARQLENRPLLRPAEVLEVVPGLIVSQHSGDGKANQYYLRGFNLDHGTDFATSLLGMPINLPTHAHGQGYSDLQFLIPELVERMQYRKGAYAADTGDFATAGSASIDYFRQLDRPFAQLTLGRHGYQRLLTAGSPELADGRLLYAVEASDNKGPWQVAENLGKLNALLRYSRGSRDSGWSVAGMAYQAQWTATDQIPERAVSSGQLDRYGSLDPSDGGKTHRYSLSGEWSARSNDGWTRGNAYLIDYALDLWSNFTYCTLGCGSAGPGDQFQQTERRQVYGVNLARTWYGDWAGKPSDFTFGVQGRFDDIGKVGLYTTSQRRPWNTVREDKVQQGSLALYGENQTQWHPRFRSILGLRADFYRFDVRSQLPAFSANSGQARDHILSPKLGLVFGPWASTEFYLNAGYGFHSNDARGTTTRINPDFRDPGYLGAVQPVTPLVRAKSYEAGIRTAPLPGLHSTLALWRLDLASELVFVGDAGTTEPSFPSRRTGIEWANYWQPGNGLTLDADLALSRARYRSYDPTALSGDRVPGAIEKAFSLGASYQADERWSAGLRLRYFGPRPLLEDNSVRSASSTLVNTELGYRPSRDSKISLAILNLFDRRVSDIDYFYASQLRGETAAVDDRHYHPAEPRTLRLTLRLTY